MLSYGFVQVDEEGTLFRFTRGEKMMILSMYVDDGLVAVNDIDFYESFLAEFRKVFTISDQGDLHHYLGIRIVRDRIKGVTELCQEQYIQDMLTRFDMQDCKPSNTPYYPDTYLLKSDCCDKLDPINRAYTRDYQVIVGALLFLSTPILRSNRTRKDGV